MKAKAPAEVQIPPKEPVYGKPMFAVMRDNSGWRAILEGQPLMDGEVLSDTMCVIAVPPMTKAEVDTARLHEYANPLTGSDRLFAEASRMKLMGEADYEAVRLRAIARYEDIKAQYPWPDEPSAK